MSVRWARFDLVLFGLFAGLTVFLFLRFGNQRWHQALEYVPVWAYFVLFGLGLPLLRGKLRLWWFWLAAFVVPWVWATAAYFILSVFYRSLGYHPYPSWDISLTYLRIAYMVVLYPYTVILVARESLVYWRESA